MVLLDTSALICGHEPPEWCVTFQVLSELDRLKTNARVGLRQRRAIRKILEAKPKVLDVEQPDADSSLLVQLRNFEGLELWTQDVALYLKQIHSGFKQVLIDEKLDDYVLNPLPVLDVENLSSKSAKLDYPGQFEGKIALLRCGEQTRLAFLNDGEARFLNPKGFSIGEVKVQQLNLEQKVLQCQLEDSRISLVTQTGSAGSGKTFLQLQVQLKLVLEGKYQHVIAAVPPVPLGGEDRYGFLPGTIQEKTINHFSGIIDNLKVIFGPSEGQKIVDEQVQCQSSVLRLQQFSNVRGRSIKNQIVIVDEQQNMTRLEAKTFLTRLDEGSKMIMLGDIEQVDTGRTGPEDNGLIATQLQFKDVPGQMHVHLKHCCRTDIQRIQAERL